MRLMLLTAWQCAVHVGAADVGAALSTRTPPEPPLIIEPFVFRVRGSPATPHHSGDRDTGFQFILQVPAREKKLLAPYGQWSNWTAFTAEDANATTSAAQPRIGRSILHLRVTGGPTHTEFSTIKVDVQFTRSKLTEPPTGLHEVEATLCARYTIPF